MRGHDHLGLAGGDAFIADQPAEDRKDFDLGGMVGIDDQKAIGDLDLNIGITSHDLGVRAFILDRLPALVLGSVSRQAS